MKTLLHLLVLAGLAALPVLVPATAGAQTPGETRTEAGDAYLDAGARELVRLARERRRLVDNRITEYRTTVRERMSAGFRIVARERLLYRRETVSRVQWSRQDTVRIEVLGAREVIPPALSAAQVPNALARSLPQLAFDPSEADMLLRLDSSAIRHPLAADGETHYRFASGDTTVIRLPDGRQVRLRELRVTARRREPQFINASFWLDAETHAIVRTNFTLARAYDSERDADGSDVPAVLRPARAELAFVAIEYGLWDLQWWLPRVVAAEGVFTLGRVRLPLRYERSYDDYSIVASDVPLQPVDTAAQLRCRPRGAFVIGARIGGEAADTIPTRTVLSAEADGCDRHWVITHAPGVDLLDSPYLPPDIYAGDNLLDDAEMREIRRMADALPQAPWRLEAPRLSYGLLDPRFVRYNRVEGLSAGAGTSIELPGSTLSGTARFSVPGREWGGELSLGGAVRGWDVRAGGYRRVESMDRWRRAFGLGSTLGALLLGSDDHDYFRATGAELNFAPGGVGGGWMDARIYAERQRALEKSTDFSVRRLLNDDWTFPENAQADAADQIGAALTMRWQHGLNPAGVRIGAALSVDGETGTYRLGRAALTGTFGAPLPGPFVLGLEAAVGSSAGTVPEQRAWRLGGAPTVRGYPVSTQTGDAFWRARAELGTALPLVRLTLFSDVGWAGEREMLLRGETLNTRAALWSAGIGASLLDGLFRVDLGRPVRGRPAWRLHAYFDGIL